MGRPSNTQARQADILAAMRVVLAREGYQGATIAAVAKQAGLSPGLLHYHFARKIDILVALVEQLGAQVDARAQRRLTRAGDAPIARLLAYADAYVARGPGMDASAVAAWAMIGAEAIRQPDVQRVYQAALADRLRQFEALWVACGQPAAAARRRAAAVVSMIEGAYQVSAGAPGALPKGYAAPMLRRTIEGLLGAR